MKVSVLITALVPLAAAAGAAKKPTPNVICQTEMGTRSVKNVPRTTVTRTTGKAKTTTSTYVPIVTKKQRFTNTITKLRTTTLTETAPTLTDTVVVTTTEYDVQTKPVTETITTTSTDVSTTESISTTVMPTITNFRNIADTVNDNRWRKRDAAALEEDDDDEAEVFAHPHAIRAASKKGLKAYTHPAKVMCTKNLPNTKTSTVRKTLKPSTTTVPYYTKTTTTRVLKATSTVVPPNVQEVETDTYVSSVTTYTTTYETSTVVEPSTTTEILPGPTEWRACTSRNIFNSNFKAGGEDYYVTNIANNGPSVGSDFKAVADGASTPEECCAHCQEFSTCETWIFREQNRNCFLLYHEGGSCKSQNQHPNFFMSKKGRDTGAGYTVGNGNCGFTYSGNTDGTVWRVDV